MQLESFQLFDFRSIDDSGIVEVSRIAELQSLSQQVLEDEQGYKKAREWVVSRLPVFIYLDEYPELDGYQNVAQYLDRKTKNQMTESDINFEKLCKVAELNPAELQGLLSQSATKRHSKI